MVVGRGGGVLRVATPIFRCVFLIPYTLGIYRTLPHFEEFLKKDWLAEMMKCMTFIVSLSLVHPIINYQPDSLNRGKLSAVNFFSAFSIA